MRVIPGSLVKLVNPQPLLLKSDLGYRNISDLKKKSTSLTEIIFLIVLHVKVQQSVNQVLSFLKRISTQKHVSISVFYYRYLIYKHK